ncbi:MAG: hypothetical protein QF486_02845 [Candidatus Woesearchaeota archaeon]|jgi:transposase-like protein|nr:hypothetical protein [Candidatus Woesearchaeota archaeon]MDP7198534.1 hypothetical protein [Candidatus Woesearchaeota archaeon]MDP7466724.1 hypothetical protein [Candidatus Woesearchaeota archaeon]
MLQCPVCKSFDITLYMGGQFGKYQCKACGYVGALVIESPGGEDGTHDSKSD